MWILEIIKASRGIVGETRSCSVNKVGALGVLKNLLEGVFNCDCRYSKVRESGMNMDVRLQRHVLVVQMLWLRLGFKGLVFSVVSCMFVQCSTSGVYLQ